MQNQFLLLKDSVGLGKWWRETRHPWEQRHSILGDAKRWEKTPAPLQVINHVIVGCVLGQRAQVTNGRDISPTCDRPEPHEAHFSHSETETIHLCA